MCISKPPFWPIVAGAAAEEKEIELRDIKGDYTAEELRVDEFVLGDDPREQVKRVFEVVGVDLGGSGGHLSREVPA